jgi:hypothetical protein
VLDYGIIPIAGSRVDDLVFGTMKWVRGNHLAEVAQHLVFSAIPYLPKRRTHFPSIEVQGVIRAAGGIGYNPSTIHSQLGTRNKADTTQFVTRVLGWKPVSISHIADAFAAAMCHALKIGVWQPHIEATPTRTPDVGRKRRGKAPVAATGILSDTPTQDEIRAAFARGEARVGK